ncbi:MAG: hypothetical protein CUN53_13695 [Phototrophicales bacterium]|nr:MAG: hypothetical protein CUN53_13695 [Phototrophicales bacterium]
MTYRVKQAVRAVRAAEGYDPEIGRAQAAAVLDAPLLALFMKLRHSEQSHSLNVLSGVCAQFEGDAPRPLAVAALLHDIGKVRLPLALWGRSFPVALHKLAPDWVNRLAARYPRRPLRLTRPCAVYVGHPTWGAEMAAEAGAPPEAVWLIAHHADPLDQWRDHPLADWLAALKRADDAN